MSTGTLKVSITTTGGVHYRELVHYCFSSDFSTSFATTCQITGNGRQKVRSETWGGQDFNTQRGRGRKKISHVLHAFVKKNPPPYKNPGSATAAYSYILSQFMLSYILHVLTSQYMMGTCIHWALFFAWVLLFRKLIATGLIVTYNHRVLQTPVFKHLCLSE